MKRKKARKNSSSTTSNTRIVLDAEKVFFTTEQLVEILKNNDDCCVEASIQLKGCQSTHFLNYHSDTGILYDEGNDGEERETTLEEFANDPFYGVLNARWRVWLNKE
jgi:hypothetical protein